jgi:hypothetical protein
MRLNGLGSCLPGMVGRCIHGMCMQILLSRVRAELFIRC